MTVCPDPKWAWWPFFEKWCDHGRLPKERPPELPRMIPAAAFACYRQRHPHPHPKPVVDYGLLAGSGWFVREPTGGSEAEKIAAAKAAWFAYLMLNARDYRGNRWDSWRLLADKAGIPVVPVGRIYDGQHPSAAEAQEVADATVHYLLDTKDAWSSPGVAFNPEDEAETVMPPTRLATLTAGFKGSMAVLVDYRGWVDQSGYHGPDWTPLADRAVGMIECFDNTGLHAINPEAGISRAHLAGFKRVVPLLGVNAGRDAYGPLAGARAGYSIDTVAAGEIASWAA